MTKRILFAIATTAVANLPIVHAVVPNAALTFSTNVKTIAVTSSQEAKIQSAERKIMAVVASDEFRNMVLNHTYNGQKTFVNNGGFTNLQIYNKFLQAAENYLKEKNNIMDLNIKTYYQNSTTVGYTTTTSSTINMNTKFLNSYNANQVSRNMTHEWLHKLGFAHAVQYSTSRNYSVPYALGSMMEKLAAKH